MNLRLVQFNLGPGRRSEAEAIADKVVPNIRKQPGCVRCDFFADPDSGDMDWSFYGSRRRLRNLRLP
jgi:quinol monooxygenase YgiN